MAPIMAKAGHRSDGEPASEGEPFGAFITCTDSRTQNLDEHSEAPWSAIVDLIFNIVSHRERLFLKRKALGRHKRKLARKRKRGAA